MNYPEIGVNHATLWRNIFEWHYIGSASPLAKHQNKVTKTLKNRDKALGEGDIEKARTFEKKLELLSTEESKGNSLLTLDLAKQAMREAIELKLIELGDRNTEIPVPIRHEYKPDYSIEKWGK